MLTAEHGAIRHGRRDKAKSENIRGIKTRRTSRQSKNWNGGGRESLYKDYKSGGSVITERLHIDIKQDFLKKRG